MKKKVSQTIIDLAVQNGYDTATLLKQANGYNVYVPDFEGDEICCIGLPQYILEKDGKVRMTKGEEGLDIMEQLDR